jgi:FkbM family methyltransferase
MAISDTNSTIRFGSIDYTFGGNYGAFELEVPAQNSDFNGIVVPGKFDEIDQRTVDHFNFNDVGLIKIDVEGMELKVLSGAVETLQRCRPVVLFEHHKTNRHEAENLLRRVGYRIIDSIGQMSCAVFNK